MGQGHVHDAARHSRRSARQRVDDRRRKLDGLQVQRRRQAAAEDRGRRPALAVPEQLLQHDRHRVCPRSAISSSPTAIATRASSSTRADGHKVNEWGTRRHRTRRIRAAAFDPDRRGDVIYVADRENGRVQRFDHSGKFLGEWTQYGKTFGLQLVGNDLWLSTIPRGPNTAPGWMIKINRETGRSAATSIPKAITAWP